MSYQEDVNFYNLYRQIVRNNIQEQRAGLGPSTGNEVQRQNAQLAQRLLDEANQYILTLAKQADDAFGEFDVDEQPSIITREGLTQLVSRIEKILSRVEELNISDYDAVSILNKNIEGRGGLLDNVNSLLEIMELARGAIPNAERLEDILRILKPRIDAFSRNITAKFAKNVQRPEIVQRRQGGATYFRGSGLTRQSTDRGKEGLNMRISRLPNSAVAMYSRQLNRANMLEQGKSTRIGQSGKSKAAHALGIRGGQKPKHINSQLENLIGRKDANRFVEKQVEYINNMPFKGHMGLQTKISRPVPPALFERIKTGKVGSDLPFLVSSKHG